MWLLVTPTCTIGRMFKVIHILDAVESPCIKFQDAVWTALYTHYTEQHHQAESAWISDCVCFFFLGDVEVLFACKSQAIIYWYHETRIDLGNQLPKAGWFITWSSKQRCLGNRFLRNGDLPYFCNISCPRILLFSHTVSASNESSFVSNRYNYHDPKLHTVGTYEAVANGALLSLVSKIVTIDRSGQEPWH